jgi:hypothetical protein
MRPWSTAWRAHCRLACGAIDATSGASFSPLPSRSVICGRIPPVTGPHYRDGHVFSEQKDRSILRLRKASRGAGGAKDEAINARLHAVPVRVSGKMIVSDLEAATDLVIAAFGA